MLDESLGKFSNGTRAQFEKRSGTPIVGKYALLGMYLSFTAEDQHLTELHPRKMFLHGVVVDVGRRLRKGFEWKESPASEALRYSDDYWKICDIKYLSIIRSLRSALHGTRT